MSRVAWGYWLVSGMTGTTPASSGGGDSYGWMSETAEQRATEQKKRLGRLYVRGRAKRALERDHLVAGSSSAMSSRGDGFGHVRGGDYEHVGARRRERRGRRAHRGAHKKARWRFRSCRGGAGDEEDRWKPEKGTKGIRCCSASELQLRPPVGEEGDGGVEGHAGAARRRLWPCDSRRRGHGGARLRWGRRGRWIWRGEGEARGPRASVGASGRGDRGARRRRPYPHASSPARWVRLGRALFRPGSGEQGKGTLCGGWAGWAGQADCGPGGWVVAVRVGWAAWSRGLPPFFVFL